MGVYVPDKESVYAESDRFPLVSVRFTTDKGPPIVTPAERFMVRLPAPFVIDGSTDVEPEPPTFKTVEELHLIVPAVFTMEPFIVSVFAGMLKTPAVQVAVPDTVSDALVSTNVSVPLFVKLFTVKGRLSPVT